MTESSSLKTQVRQVASDVSIIHISGDVTGMVEDELMAAYNTASNGRAHTIILNFTDLDYMNSSGIGLLVTLLIRAQRQKQRLLACGLTDHYRQIFSLTRLDEAIGIFDSEADAVTAVTTPA